MISLFEFARQHMLVVFFFYGLAFFFLGASILLQHDKRSTLRLRSLLLLLAAFGLLHGVSEWADMFLTLGETYWTLFLFRAIKITSFYLAFGSFVVLLMFGFRSVVLDKTSLKWLEPALLVSSLLLAIGLGLYGIRTGLSSQWYAASGALARYFLAFPGSLLAAAGFFRQSRTDELKKLNSPSLLRNVRRMGFVFVVYALLAGVVVPKSFFPPATYINYRSFETIFGFPVQIFRAACSLLAAWFAAGILSALSAESYRELEKQVQQRTWDLAQANKELVRDITVRQRVEADLEQSRDAALEASRVKADFLANMSHEIRTPMNGIIGMTDLALDTELTREQREYLNTVKTSGASLLSLINDILDFSKIEAGKLETENIEFSLRDRLEETIGFLSIHAHQKGLELTCHIPSDVPNEVVGDPIRLNQIVLNLVGNALKFTSAGEIAVRVESESKTEGHITLHFSVADTGPGIPSDKQKLIFEAFTQSDNSMTRKHGGTGLGLSISAKLVGLLGGNIWVESQPGQGSAFHFTVSFGLRESGPKLDSIGVESLHGISVLIVDDNATNRTVLREILMQWHMRINEAGSGTQAIELMQAEKNAGRAYDLVLLDRQMPGVDGFDVAEQIRRDPDLTGAVVVMLTSANLKGDAARCIELGITACLSKPVKRTDLLNVIKLALFGTRDTVQDSAPAVAATADKRHFKILLTEDNLVNQRVAVRFLEKRGHTVVLAESGKKALKAWRDQPFDLILMDIQMPEMDGLEATAMIRAQELARRLEPFSVKHTPIIAMTAHAMVGDRDRCIAAGMDDYVSKPINAHDLFAAIDRVTNATQTSFAPPKHV